MLQEPAIANIQSLIFYLTFVYEFQNYSFLFTKQKSLILEAFLHLNKFKQLYFKGLKK